MRLKCIFALILFASILNGCATQPLDEQRTQAVERQLSEAALKSYRDCLRKNQGYPGNVIRNCNVLYGMATYYRRDYKTALNTFQPLASQGEPRAQYFLGLMYWNGTEVTQDKKMGLGLYRQAAEQCYIPAAETLAHHYEQDGGLPQDNQEALKLRQLAADSGGTNAQLYLGNLYQEGKGVPKDYVKAHVWYSLSAANGNQVGELFRDSLAEKMTPIQIAEAYRLVSEWRLKKCSDLISGSNSK